MLFPPEDVPAVKQWLIHELEPLCDADPDVLADYVLALFRYDSGEDELKHTLNEQLLDFLEGNTAPFVENAFATLKSRAYLDAVHGTKRVADEPADEPSKRVAPDAEMAEAEEEGDATGYPDSTGTGPLVQPDPTRRRLPKGLCRDYHTVGFCARGANCRFQHSDDSIMGSVPTADAFPAPGMFPPSFFPPMPVGPDGQMPPMPVEFAQALQAGMIPMPWMPPVFDGGRGGRRGRGRGGRSAFPAPARSATTLVVENIPPEYLDMAKVNDYFKRFGTITNVSVDEPGAKALVSYATHEEADAAHKNPDVIFGNRFVKVYFQRLERPRRPLGHAQPSRPNYMTEKGSNVYLAPALREAAEASRGVDAERHKQLELRKKKQALLNMQLAEQKTLLGKLDSPDLTPHGRESIMAMLGKLSGEISSTLAMVKKDMEAPQQGETTAALQAKLAALKQEAAALGLDAGRGRGRGGFRGSFRGRGGAFRGGFNPAQFRLDNRTTRIGVSGLPATYDAEALHAHMRQFGELASMDRTDGGDIVVTYKARRPAELALRAGGAIAGVGDVALAWVEAPRAPPAGPGADADADADAPVAQLEDAAGREDEREDNWKR